MLTRCAHLNGARPTPRDQPQRLAGREAARTLRAQIQAKLLRVGHPRSGSWAGLPVPVFCPADFTFCGFNGSTPRFALASRAFHPNALAMEKPDPFRGLFRLRRAFNERTLVRTDGTGAEQKANWFLNCSKHT
jgi:hypothetical protein